MRHSYSMEYNLEIKYVTWENIKIIMNERSQKQGIYQNYPFTYNSRKLKLIYSDRTEDEWD